jgi:hypothetical protein
MYVTPISLAKIGTAGIVIPKLSEKTNTYPKRLPVFLKD